jgi:hypothetical protein
MIFVIKSLSKPYWIFKNNIKLIKNIYISKLILYLNFKFMCFILINSCIIFQISFLIISFLIWLKGIETNYLYVHQTNFILKINHMKFFLQFIVIWNLLIQKGKWQPKKIKMIRGMIIKSVTQHSYFEKKPNKK